MSDLQDPTRESLAATVRDLVERHGGPTKVGRMVGADRTAVHRWMKGDIALDRLGQLADRLDEPVIVRFGPDATKEPPPEWAGAMEERLTAELLTNRALIEALAPDDIQAAAARVIARLEALGPQGDGVPSETGAAEGPDEEGPRGQRPEPHPGPVGEG